MLIPQGKRASRDSVAHYESGEPIKPHKRFDRAQVDFLHGGTWPASPTRSAAL